MPGPKTYTFVCNEIAKLIIIPTIFRHNGCIMKVRTLIDTGAANSYVSQYVSKCLSIPETGNLYHVKFAEKDAVRSSIVSDIILSSDVSFDAEEFTVLEDEPRTYDAIIGMNILSRLDFSVSNHSGHTIFTFRYPAQGDIKYGDTVISETAIDSLMEDIQLL